MARAAPLSPDERRRTIIAATIPLLRTYGKSVTTAQIAMAAGVAEGTLFRVFPDKDTLIQAAVQAAFTPGPGEREIGAIDVALPLREKLIAAVGIIQRRVTEIWQLITMLGLPAPITRDAKADADAAKSDPLHEALVELISSHAAELRCDPAYAARMFRIVAFAGTHPRIAAGTPLAPPEIVAVVLDGIRRRPDSDLDLDLDDTHHAPDSEESPC